MPRIREASHAGSWYTDDGNELDRQLSQWLANVPSTTPGIGAHSAQQALDIPSSGARVIIAPHAGYSYSGPAAAWAYKALDLTNVKRVFLLGPSHHHYLTTCALSKCDVFKTPLGNLTLDKAINDELRATGKFQDMSQSVDEAEHSLEMHMPYIYKMLSTVFPPEAIPPLIPIMIGATSASTEKSFGRLLAPYLADTQSLFVVSSDFCHWGSRFRYTYYQPTSGAAYNLTSRSSRPVDPPIHGSIGVVDKVCMDAIETGSHEEFLRVLESTGNTVCGRHPIGVVMAALESLANEGARGSREKGKFQFVRYERSSDCMTYHDSSVSYCSAFAVI